MGPTTYVLIASSNLETTRFLDAADDGYGESIPALLLIDGWHMKRLLIMICFAVLISLVVTVLAAAVRQSIDRADSRKLYSCVSGDIHCYSFLFLVLFYKK